MRRPAPCGLRRDPLLHDHAADDRLAAARLDALALLPVGAAQVAEPDPPLGRLDRARHRADLLAAGGERRPRAGAGGERELDEAALEVAARGRAEHDLLPGVAALRERDRGAG